MLGMLILSNGLDLSIQVLPLAQSISYNLLAANSERKKTGLSSVELLAS